MITLDELNDMSTGEFVEQLKDIFEHSPWVANSVADKRPFQSLRTLHSTMVQAVADASKRKQIDLICAHPDLAGKAALAGELTESSTSEQAGAGLDSLSNEEYAEFHKLNDAYKSKFGFPFILAVKGHDKTSILQSFRTRLENDADQEKIEALRQIGEIGRFRLEALLTQEN
ncbi:MAG: 2-oxo-4-hydroxy-4-carboxy-5-ureidoimidazoline decarboxylase [Rhizobiaceae bacterium]